MAKVAPVSKKREISVVERRLKSGSIFAISAGSIPLKEPGRWELREVNSEIRTGRIREMVADKQWQFAEEADLAVVPYDIGYRILAGKLVKGVHGELVLMKMERTDFRAVQLLKDQENRRNTFGAAAVKSAIVNAASQEPDGAQAAEYLNRAVQGVDVKDSTERVSLED